MDYVDLVAQTAFQLGHKHHHNHTHLPAPIYPGVDRITESGLRTLWVVFGILAVSSLGVLGLMLPQQPKHRLFHQITFLILTFASISYWGMATGAGATYILVPGQKKVRQLLWARYADWAVTTPLLLLDLTLLAGLPGAEIVLIIIADLGMVLTGTFAALSTHELSRWGFYTFSCIFFVYVIYSLVVKSRATAVLRSERVGNLYTSISIFTVVLWIGYPIVWGLGEGSSTISPNKEVLLYGILDVLAKPVFAFWLLIAHSNIAESNVVLPSSWTESRGAAGGYGALGDSLPAH